jgi:hypothetical protein
LAVVEPNAVEELARAIAVPDFDAGFGKRQRRRAAFDEPQQLLNDGAEKNTFCGEERKDRLQRIVVEAELYRRRRKDGNCPCSCAMDRGLDRP